MLSPRASVRNEGCDDGNRYSLVSLMCHSTPDISRSESTLWRRNARYTKFLILLFALLLHFRFRVAKFRRYLHFFFSRASVRLGALHVLHILRKGLDAVVAQPNILRKNTNVTYPVCESHNTDVRAWMMCVNM